MSLLEKLRDEIIETQRIQASFARWKLVLIAALGGAAIGIPPNELHGESWALLGLLPFVCLYADALVYNSGVRVLVIAHYLRTRTELKTAPQAATHMKHDDDEWEIVSNYETFLKEQRRHFDLEVLAFRNVTVGVSLIVAAMGARRWLLPPLGAGSVQDMSILQDCWLIVTGLSGIGLGIWLYRRHSRKVNLIDGTPT